MYRGLHDKGVEVIDVKAYINDLLHKSGGIESNISNSHDDDVTNDNEVSIIDFESKKMLLVMKMKLKMKMKM